MLRWSGDPTDLKLALNTPSNLVDALGLVSGIYFSWIHPSEEGSPLFLKKIRDLETYLVPLYLETTPDPGVLAGVAGVESSY